VAGFPTNRISRERTEPTGPVWDRLLNTRRPIGATATDRIRLPIGIGVGITRGLRMDAAPTHRFT
jgi:hypothetical protein